MTLRTTQALVVVLALSFPAIASAELTVKDDAPHTRATHLDAFVLAGFVGYTHFGAGAWFAYPILPDGFIKPWNDALFIEAGGALERYSWDWGSFGVDCSYSWMRLTPMGGARWSVYLTPEWAVFATAKLGYGIGFADNYDCGGYNGSASEPSLSSFEIDSSLGAHWQLSDGWQARFEMGYFGAQVGAGMDLSTVN